MGKKLRILEIYAVVSGLVIVLLGFAVLKPARVINAERINIIGVDGKPRLALCNKEELPDGVMNGKVLKRSEKHAGMIFYNDEGVEDGGLIFGGEEKNGLPSAGASLTFDQYMQDQAIQLLYAEGGGKRTAHLAFYDRPEIPMDELDGRFALLEKLPDAEKNAGYKKMKEEGLLEKERLFIGKDWDKSSKLILSDDKGQPRIEMQVTADGSAELLFLDAAGKVTKKIKG